MPPLQTGRRQTVFMLTQTKNSSLINNPKNYNIMKTIIKLLLLTATATLLAACAKENKESKSYVAAQITAEMSGPKTRASNANWNNDQIGVMVTNAPSSNMATIYKNVGYKTISTGTSADFQPTTANGGIFFKDPTEEVTFAAYAPYVASTSDATLPGNDGAITVDTRTQGTTAAQESIDYIYATGAKGSKATPSIQFKNGGAGNDHSFKHKMTRLVLKIKISGATDFANANVLNLADYTLGGLIHDGTFNITTGTATANSTTPVNDWKLRECTGAASSRTATDKCIANYDNGSGIMTLTMILLPQTLSSALSFSMVPDDGENKTYSNTTSIQPALEAEKSYTYTITVKKTGLTITGSTITDWINGGNTDADATM